MTEQATIEQVVAAIGNIDWNVVLADPHIGQKEREAIILEAQAGAALSALKPGDVLPNGLVVEHGWQPIATAPKDGTVMLLCCQDLCARYGYWDHIGIADWLIADSKGDDPSGWVCPYQDDGFDPTHWRPLPAPPKGGE